MARPENLDRFRELLHELLEGPGSAAALEAEFDRIYSQIKDILLGEPFSSRVAGKRPSDYPQWQAEARGLRDYIHQRNDGVRQQLQGYREAHDGVLHAPQAGSSCDYFRLQQSILARILS